ILHTVLRLRCDCRAMARESVQNVARLSKEPLSRSLRSMLENVVMSVISFHVYLSMLCISCERSLNYATKMARMLQSSTLKFTGKCVACMLMI
ncbi:hypothetical protein L9F63_012155, partial [Diploptera punctata]